MEDCIRNRRFMFDIPVGERIGFVFPVYFYGLPRLVEDFVGRMQIFTKERNYTYVALTMGGSSGNAGKALKHLLSEAGLSLDATFGVIMPDTWTPMFDLSDEGANARVLDKAEPEITEICHMVSEGVCGDSNRHKGFWRFLSPVMRGSYARLRTSKFRVSQDCVMCGRCVENCPDSAIEFRVGYPVWVKDRCCFCLRCLHNCPEFAISFGRNTDWHGQYVNPNVEV